MFEGKKSICKAKAAFIYCYLVHYDFFIYFFLGGIW